MGEGRKGRCCSLLAAPLLTLGDRLQLPSFVSERRREEGEGEVESEEDAGTGMYLYVWMLAGLITRFSQHISISDLITFPFFACLFFSLFTNSLALRFPSPTLFAYKCPLHFQNETFSQP